MRCQVQVDQLRPAVSTLRRGAPDPMELVSFIHRDTLYSNRQNRHQCDFYVFPST